VTVLEGEELKENAEKFKQRRREGAENARRGTRCGVI
jgi:hypothetical protein